MLLRGPSRFHHVLVLLLWMWMFLLIWQHYHGLNHGSAGQKIKRKTTSSSQSEDSQDKETTSSITLSADHPQHPIAPTAPNGIEALLSSTAKSTEYFVNVAIQPSEFSQLGGRLQVLSTWLSARETLSSLMSSSQLTSLDSHIERTIISLFPFIRHPKQPKNAQPFNTLRKSFGEGSSGIVIVGHKSNLRHILHAIQNIRTVLNSSLPIQVAHAGDRAFPPSLRRLISNTAPNVTTINIPTLLDPKPTNLERPDAAPALRPFAALASSFEQVILIDPKTIFLQPPTAVLENHSAYRATGALFFHDHLYGKGDSKERHEFWQGLMKYHPHSQSLRSSRVYNEGYTEESDGGVVVLDKSRTNVMLGLLHTCWQNSKRVRRDYTYKYGNGDRDSWWLGFELAGVPYSWESRYGGTLGWLHKRTGKPDRVCGNMNLHLDEQDRPLWFSGGLMENSNEGGIGGAPGTGSYKMPTHWMVDGVFQKMSDEKGRDCMWGDTIHNVGVEEAMVLEESIEAAGRAVEKSRVYAVTHRKAKKEGG
ncbi:MAG: hypothetical protein Q9204_002828 [Flavoplaca sp. TL-2023a]